MLENTLKDLKSIQDLVFLKIRSFSDSVDDDIRISKAGRGARALLLILMAGLGDCGFDMLRPVGAALELLDLGMSKHFSDRPSGNMGLIVADHYFATGLNMVVELEENWIVKTLSDALQEVSDGKHMFPRSYYKGLKKRSAFYRAACDIGAKTAKLSGGLADASSEFGIRLGMAIEAERETQLPKPEIAELFAKAHNSLTHLPAPAVYNRIKEATDAVVFS